MIIQAISADASTREAFHQLFMAHGYCRQPTKGDDHLVYFSTTDMVRVSTHGEITSRKLLIVAKRPVATDKPSQTIDLDEINTRSAVKICLRRFGVGA